MWETIGPYGGRPTEGAVLDAGWSSGAAPALTKLRPGGSPTSPGFATFTVRPHTDGLGAAEGDVPTPHGMIHVAWAQTARDLVLHVDAPTGTEWVTLGGLAAG